MKRLAGAMFLAALLVALQSIALSAPVTDLQHESLTRTVAALAADGTIDAGALYGNVNPSRYEMAVLTARAVAQIEASGGSQQDVLRVQHLMSALRDELDALGVRATSVEEARNALDRRTQAARKSVAEDVQVQVDAREPFGIPLATSWGARLVPNRPMQSSIAGLAFHASPDALNAVSALTNTDARAVYLSMTRTLDSAPAGYVAFGSPQGVQRSQNMLRITHTEGGAVFGLSYNRIFDRAGSLPLSSVALNDGLVSNTIFGVDVAVPVFTRSGLQPSIYAEGSSSTFSSAPRTADALSSRISPAWTDNAMVAGIKFHIRNVTGKVQYQVVGTNFSNVASDSYFGSTPDFFANDARPYTPQIGPLAGLVAPQARAGPAFSNPYSIPDPFNAGAPDFHAAFTPGSQGVNLEFTTPVRIGSMTLQSTVGAAHVQETAPSSFAGMQYCTGATQGCTFYSNQRATDDRLSAGTTFHLRAWGKPVAFDLGASVERLSRNDRSAFTYVPYNAAAQTPDSTTLVALPGGSPITFNPNFVDVTRRSINAAAVVPISRDLTLGVQYNTQFYRGSYSALGQNIDQRKDFYLGNVTYNIPRTASAIVFSAKQYRYRDAFVPANNLTQNRADLNFTVKF